VFSTFQIPLPGYIENIKEKLAENLHELWAMGKIENGWIWGEVSDAFYILEVVSRFML